MESNIIFRNVNIDEIKFINFKNDMIIVFIDSLRAKAYCGSLTCLDVRTFNMSIADYEDDVDFPQFVCDIIAEEEDGKTRVSFLGSNYDIEIACAEIVCEYCGNN
jgi:hypothetical protein